MDSRTLAFINLHAVLGGLTELCRLSPQARAIISGKYVSIGFEIKNGPSATLHFAGSGCEMTEGVEKCDIKLPFSSPEKFNGMIDGTVTPIPSRGFTKIGFLTGEFTRLTDLLTAYLRPNPEGLEDEEFFRVSTRVMFHVIVAAIAQIGNEDSVGRASASYIPDGRTKIEICGETVAYIDSKDHRLSASFDGDGSCTAFMEFQDIRLARALFDGQVNSMACIGQGTIRMGGMIPQVDNINRILDRVALYLA
jgi:hypothetical protein